MEASGPFRLLARDRPTSYLPFADAALPLLVLFLLDTARRAACCSGCRMARTRLFLLLPDRVAFLRRPSCAARRNCCRVSIVDHVQLRDLLVVQLDLVAHLLDAALADLFRVILRRPLASRRRAARYSPCTGGRRPRRPACRSGTRGAAKEARRVWIWAWVRSPADSAGSRWTGPTISGASSALASASASM